MKNGKGLALAAVGVSVIVAASWTASALQGQARQRGEQGAQRAGEIGQRLEAAIGRLEAVATRLEAASGVSAGGSVGSLPTAAPAIATVDAIAPDFTLVDTSGVKHTLSTYTKEGKTVVLEWFNPGCPFVVKQYANDIQRMNELEAKYAAKDVVWLRINSGAPGLQGHGVELNGKIKTDWKISGPILLDESGTVGKAYQAKTTPAMYVIDSKGVLRYAGAIDNNRQNPPSAGDTVYVQQALDAILSNRAVETKTTQSYGCGVKYAG